MQALFWITASGIAMIAIAAIGAVTFALSRRSFDTILLPLVAFSAGALLGGAFFHMIPAASQSGMPEIAIFSWVFAGFSTFFVLEQFLHWHHCRHADSACRKPLTYLILIADALHNFLGGLAVAGTFLTDLRLGFATWLAAVAHEIPQELGDFGVMVHGGWGKRRALFFNMVSATTFLLGGWMCFAVSRQLDVDFLVPFAAGNFIYIGASDLVPEVNKHYGVLVNAAHFGCFIGGAALLLGIRYLFE